jgi:CheY-like chemotaxis protein
VPILADPGQMEQVLLNLVVNARDAMTGGGGALRLETEVSASWGVLTVRDNGCGMDEATRERIFEPFFTTKADLGTGLGLATVFGIVQQGGGQIDVESTPGAGTTFRVSWPLTRGDPAPAVERRPTPGATTGKETILVVEDEEAVRTVLVRLLQRLEYTVLEAINGVEAIRRAETHAGPIDLLLADVMLPGADGAEVAEAVRTHRPGVRVLFLSGYAPDSMIARGISLEGAAFLQKPFTMEVLGRKVREVLDTRDHSA